MKRFLILLFMLLLFGHACAIVIVPPVVFFATVSILSVAFNMFVGMFFWVAAQGIASKKFFGKPMHSVLGFALGSIGKLLFVLALAVLLLFLFSPVELPEIALTSAAVAFLSSIALFLSRFRLIRNSQRKHGAVAGIAIFGMAVFAISFFSILFSVQITSVYGGQYEKIPFTGEPFGSQMPFAGSSSAPAYEERVADISKKLEEGAPVFVESLWLIPSSSEKCILSVGSEQVSFFPNKGCVKATASGLERVFCPIEVLPSITAQRGGLWLNAGGSCQGSMKAIVSDEGFEVLPNGS